MASNVCSPIIYRIQTSLNAKHLDGAFSENTGRKLADPRPCEGCSQTFRPKAYNSTRAGRGRFCSPSCASRANALKRLAGFWKGEQNGNFKGWVSKQKRAYVNRYRARYPLQAAANDAVSKAIRTGALLRPAACERCGGKPSHEPLHGHHDDYTKPLTVRWVCRKCHRAIHAEVRHAS